MNKFAAVHKIREYLAEGKQIVGSWMQLPCPEVAEILGGQHFHFVGVDLEHSNITRHQLPNIFRALELGNTLPLVRIAKPDSFLAIEALEQGAAGIIVPQIRSKSQLSEIKESFSLPPRGTRGMGFNRGNLYGHKFHEYREGLGQEPLLIGMIEHYEAVKNIDEILSVGIDAALIGPYDLSGSLGCAGDFENPKYLQVLEEYKKGCLRNNVPIGYHIPGNHLSKDPMVEFLERREEGYTFIVYSGDICMFNYNQKKMSEFILHLEHQQQI